MNFRASSYYGKCTTTQNRPCFKRDRESCKKWKDRNLGNARKKKKSE